ncbi:uncharacterized protein V6R79_024730 [Siganus canaliculatus]
MAFTAAFWVLVLLLGIYNVDATSDTLSTQDSSLCRGGVEVIYPDLDIDKCMTIPRDSNLREKISKVWNAPQIYVPQAHKKKMYVLVMVDPDAPSRANPTSAFWRHWLVVDIKGSALLKGQTKGTTLTDYFPPTPPPGSGLHRYQFMLFEQPPDTAVTLSKQEKSARGKWDLQAFIKRFSLGKPVAALQFLTQNYKD